jgi:deoxycytidylate deaminase
MELSIKKIALLHYAMNLAMSSSMRCRHACILVINGKIISEGVNHYRGCLNNKCVPFVHAEISALWKLLRKDKQCFL